MGGFGLLALVMALSGLPALKRIAQHYKTIFDRQFTPNDRVSADQAAIFILLPIAVALHELGHATMVWLFGAHVDGFGYYFFAGYVSYEGNLTNVQAILIASAGTAVNILLGFGAVALVLFRRPPMRAAFNELLIQFAIVSLANALLFYPVLDLLSGINGGDFHQMYDGGVPWLSFIILAMHLSAIGLGWYLMRGEGPRRRLNALTELPPQVNRGIFGGFRVRKDVPPAGEPQLSAAENVMRQSLARVSGGWDTQISGSLVRMPHGSALVATWSRDDLPRAITTVQNEDGSISVVVPARGVVRPPDALQGREWQRWPGVPTEDQLTFAIRLAMEDADARAMSYSGNEYGRPN